MKLFITSILITLFYFSLADPLNGFRAAQGRLGSLRSSIRRPRVGGSMIPQSNLNGLQNLGQEIFDGIQQSIANSFEPVGRTFNTGAPRRLRRPRIRGGVQRRGGFRAPWGFNTIPQSSLAVPQGFIPHSVPQFSSPVFQSPYINPWQIPF